MKSFVCKVILLLIVITFALIVINDLYIHTNFWIGESYVNKFSEIPYDIEIANLGSSHGLYSFKYDNIKEFQAYNFALLAQPYYYDWKLLENYIDHFKTNGVVLILISYFEITGRPDYSEYRYRYYRILPKSALDSVSLKEEFCYYRFPLLSAKNNLLKIVHDIPVESMNPYYNRTSFMDEETLQFFCEEEYKRWTKPENEKGKLGYRLNISEVSEMIDLCYSHKLIPVLITTPVTDVLNKIYEKDVAFFPTFEQFSKDLISKHPDVIYLDYSRDEYFSTKHELFLDGDHLNNMGADEFTRTVIQDLQEKGVILKK